MRARTLILVASLLCASAHVALADEASDFEKARNAYVKKDYVEAVARFDAMLDPQKGTLKTKELINEATFCFGAVRFAQGKLEDAHKLWERIIISTAGQYRPDPLQYPTPVLNDFIDENNRLNNAVRLELARQAALEEERHKREAAEKARLESRVKELEQLTAQETVVIPHSRFVAALPFGIGQFQNGKNAWGWFFLLTESTAILTTCILFAPYRYNIDQYNAALQIYAQPDQRNGLANEYSVRAQDIRTADFIILGALGVLMIAGFTEAQVNFVPERTFTRPRKTSPSVLPTVTPLAGGGASVGLVGRF